MKYGITKTVCIIGINIFILLFACKNSPSEVGMDGKWHDSKQREIKISDSEINISDKIINEILNSSDMKSFIEISKKLGVNIDKENLRLQFKDFKDPSVYNSSSLLDPVMWLFPVIGDYYYATRDPSVYFAMKKIAFTDDFSDKKWREELCTGPVSSGQTFSTIFATIYISIEHSTNNPQISTLDVSFVATEQNYLQKIKVSFPISECTISNILDNYERQFGIS